MKKVAVWVVVLMLVFTNTGFALDFGDALGDAFGGLTAMFAPKAEDAHLPGEVVELDDMNITLTNVYESKGNDLYTPEEGMEYMMIEFTVENTGDEELALSTLLSFSTWCDGEICEISLDALATGLFAGRMQLDCVVDQARVLRASSDMRFPPNGKK